MNEFRVIPNGFQWERSRFYSNFMFFVKKKKKSKNNQNKWIHS